jgi:hypothetical protein
MPNRAPERVRRKTSHARQCCMMHGSSQQATFPGFVVAVNAGGEARTESQISSLHRPTATIMRICTHKIRCGQRNLRSHVHQCIRSHHAHRCVSLPHHISTLTSYHSATERHTSASTSCATRVLLHWIHQTRTLIQLTTITNPPSSLRSHNTQKQWMPNHLTIGWHRATTLHLHIKLLYLSCLRIFPRCPASADLQYVQIAIRSISYI